MPTPDKGERWGILGGAFDPVHLGHTTLAHDLYLKKQLDGVLFVPAYNHPFKNSRAVASYEDRVEMVKLAISHRQFFVLEEIEREKQLSGFTLDTVKALKERYPQVEFCFLVGADNISEIHKWHNPELIFEEVQMLAGTRPSYSPDSKCDPLLDEIEYIETSPIDVSSSEIRDLIKSGKKLNLLEDWIDPKVREYIEKRVLYT